MKKEPMSTFKIFCCIIVCVIVIGIICMSFGEDCYTHYRFMDGKEDYCGFMNGDTYSVCLSGNEYYNQVNVVKYDGCIPIED